MKIRTVRAELFQADRQTNGQRRTDRQADMIKLVVAFGIFAKEPTNLMTACDPLLQRSEFNSNNKITVTLTDAT